jgi:hypothetical protein
MVGRVEDNEGIAGDVGLGRERPSVIRPSVKKKTGHIIAAETYDDLVSVP